MWSNRDTRVVVIILLVALVVGVSSVLYVNHLINREVQEVKQSNECLVWLDHTERSCEDGR